MAEATLDQAPVLAGAGTIYHRRNDGPWCVYFWVKAEWKRFRRSLEEVVDKWIVLRSDRIKRGEIRPEEYVRNLASVFRT